MSEVWRRKEVQSPCVNICVIHRESGLCMGCLRSAEEIASWGKIGNRERESILAALPARAPKIRGKRRKRRGESK